MPNAQSIILGAATPAVEMAVQMNLAQIPLLLSYDAAAFWNLRCSRHPVDGRDDHIVPRRPARLFSRSAIPNTPAHGKGSEPSVTRKPEVGKAAEYRPPFVRPFLSFRGWICI